MRYEWPDREVRAGLAVSLVRNDGVLVAAASTRHEGVSLSPSGTAVFRIPAFPFLAGQYAFSVYLVDEGALIYDQRLNQGGFRVSYDGWQVGLAPLEHAWEFPQASEARR
jgi:hypothetical protein